MLQYILILFLSDKSDNNTSYDMITAVFFPFDNIHTIANTSMGTNFAPLLADYIFDVNHSVFPQFKKTLRIMI